MFVLESSPLLETSSWTTLSWARSQKQRAQSVVAIGRISEALIMTGRRHRRGGGGEDLSWGSPERPIEALVDLRCGKGHRVIMTTRPGALIGAGGEGR